MRWQPIATHVGAGLAGAALLKIGQLVFGSRDEDEDDYEDEDEDEDEAAEG